MRRSAQKLENRAIKTLFKTLFIVFFICLVPYSAVAYIPQLPATEIILEDFENYPYISEGEFLTEENSDYYIFSSYEYYQLKRLVYSGYDWVGIPYSTSSNVNFSYLFPKATSTDKRVYVENSINGIIDISFDWYPGRQSNNASRFANPLAFINAWNENEQLIGNIIELRQGFSADSYDIYMTYSENNAGGSAGGTEIYASPWDWTIYGGIDRFRIQIDPVAQQFRWQIYYYYNSTLSAWSDWKFLKTNVSGSLDYITINFGGTNAFYLDGSYGIAPFVDNISYVGQASWPYYNYSYDMGLNVSYPEIGTITEITATTTNSTGTWSVSEYSSIVWERITVLLKDLSTLKTRAYYQEIEGTPGSSGNFDIELYDLEDANYQLCWAGTGKTPGSWWYRWIYFYCEDENRTILRVGNFPDFPRYILLEEYEECDFDDCSGLGNLSMEKLTCEIKNFMTGLTCPDPEKLLDLNLSIKEITLNRFPMSYLRIAKNEYDFLREEIIEKDDFTISILGNESNINVSFFDNIEAPNGTTLTEYIKIFLNGLIVLSFVMFTIYILMRMF